MGSRIRAVAVTAVVLAVGAFLGSAASQWWRPSGVGDAVEAPGARPPAAPAERIRVEILNGGGVEGMARSATDHLRERGFDVVEWGNAERFDHEASVVLDRVGRPGLARAVADALGIPDVRNEPDSNLYLDVSVVLGRGWERPAGEAGAATAVADRPWWDIRRFFDADSIVPDTTGRDSPGRAADPGEDGRKR